MTVPSPSEPASVTVDLGRRSYPIHIGAGVLGRAGRLIKPHLHRPFTAIVTDENVAALHLEALQRSLAESGIEHVGIVLPAGEATKCFAQLETLCRQLLRAGIERNDTIIALGGGVVGDIAGFAAGILRRGVEFIQIPTTVLAQVDSSVGGKTGINTPEGKNLIGAFHQPRAVLADTGVLATLPARQFRSGYAEIVKYGLIEDPDFFEWLESRRRDVFALEPAAISRAILVSCRAKAAIVARDEREGSVRALLNLGHTFGHALEAAAGYDDTITHGEAVAIGMVMAHDFSVRLGLCPGQDAGRAAAHIKAAGLPVDAGQLGD
ncbi:MAG TPA: 3-dehydroquinate synthase, partial [Rhodobacteraceae bacterium]|nr:3-dehydroquinate synthase [Paracoccaceae bacterium]